MIGPGISSHLLVPNAQDPDRVDRILVGFRDGSIERFEREGDGLSIPTLIYQRSSAPITHLVAGYRQLVLVGFADGRVILMNQATGRTLDSIRLHGAIRFLELDGDEVHAITDLGNAFSWNVATFNLPKCILTCSVWRDTPVIWSLGQAAKMPLPKSHVCRTP